MSVDLCVNAFYAGALLTLVMSVTTLGIDSSSISVLPIAADVYFHVVQGRRSSSRALRYT